MLTVEHRFCRRLPLSAAVMACFVLFTAPFLSAEPDRPLHELQRQNRAIYEKMQPSVISITCNVPNENNPKQGPYIGTGVIISSDGYLLSNTSVVPPGAKEIKIIFSDQREKEARLVGASLRFEVALLKMEGKGYDPLPIGESKKAEVGDTVYTAGNAFGLAQRQSNYNFSSGIISGIYRTESVYWQSQYKGLQIEADSSINPGLDGGPMVNLNGRLIGIISLTADRARWLGMAVPTHLFMSYVKVLRSFESGSRDVTGDPYLGVELTASNGDPEGDLDGINVKNVTRRSPAWYAGFRKGDLLYRADGTDVGDINDMVKIMKNKKPGDQFLAFIKRGHQKWALQIRVGTEPF